MNPLPDVQPVTLCTGSCTWRVAVHGRVLHVADEGTIPSS